MNEEAFSSIGRAPRYLAWASFGPQDSQNDKRLRGVGLYLREEGETELQSKEIWLAAVLADWNAKRG